MNVMCSNASFYTLGSQIQDTISVQCFNCRRPLYTRQCHRHWCHMHCGVTYIFALWFIGLCRFLGERGYGADVAKCRRMFPGMLTFRVRQISLDWRQVSS